MKDHWIVKLLFSTRTMTFLLFAFAVSMAVGTWIEHLYDTPTSKKWIYNAWWFSAMMLLLVLNFIGNIKRYQLFQWKKMGDFNVAFIVDTYHYRCWYN